MGVGLWKETLSLWLCWNSVGWLTSLWSAVKPSRWWCRDDLGAHPQLAAAHKAPRSQAGTIERKVRRARDWRFCPQSQRSPWLQGSQMSMQLNALSGLLLCAGTFKLPSLVPSVSASLLSVEILSSPGHVLWRTIQFCHQGHFQNFDVEMMSFFLLSLIQQLVHKKLFILPKLLPFNYAKPPQKLISGAPQLKSNMSWCFSNCNYLENFHFTSKLFTYLLEIHDKRS